MKLYDDYTNRIRAILDRPRFEHFDGRAMRVPVFAGMKDAEWTKIPSSLIPLQQELGTAPDYNLPLGAHPDFAYIRTSDEVERHYVSSMFIDICNSTALFREYDEETVSYITGVIQKAAIHTCLVCGGYVQRLQGDGLFVYFGRRGQLEKEATQRGLLAASLISLFVKEELPTLFEQDDIEKISTRIGFDFGDATNILWIKAGIGATSEVTTCGLHTSLAAKMQSMAAEDGIVVGHNVVYTSGVSERFFTPVSKRTGIAAQAHIYKKPKQQWYYAQFDFNWKDYLRSLPQFYQTNTGDVELKTGADKVVRPELVLPIASKVKPYRP